MGNPVNRRPLSRSECASLDNLLLVRWGGVSSKDGVARQGKPASSLSDLAKVLDAYDLQQNISAKITNRNVTVGEETTSERRARQLQREAGTVLNSLFQFGRQARDNSGGKGSMSSKGKCSKNNFRPSGGKGRSIAEMMSAEARSGSHVIQEGNLQIIDDDAYVFDYSHVRRQEEEDFPSLSGVNSSPSGGFHFAQWPAVAQTANARITGKKGPKKGQQSYSSGSWGVAEWDEDWSSRPRLQLKKRSEDLPTPKNELGDTSKSSKTMSIFGSGKARNVVEEYDHEAADDALFKFMEGHGYLLYSKELLQALLHESDTMNLLKKVEKEVEDRLFPLVAAVTSHSSCTGKRQLAAAGTFVEILFTVPSESMTTLASKNSIVVEATDVTTRQWQIRVVSEFASHCFLDITESMAKKLDGDVPSKTLQLAVSSRSRHPILPSRMAFLAEPLLGRTKLPGDSATRGHLGGWKSSQVLLDFTVRTAESVSSTPCQPKKVLTKLVLQETISTLGSVYHSEVLLQDGETILLGMPTRQKALAFITDAKRERTSLARAMWFTGAEAWLLEQKRWFGRKSVVKRDEARAAARDPKTLHVRDQETAEKEVNPISEMRTPANPGDDKKHKTKSRTHNAFAALLPSDVSGSSESDDDLLFN